MLNPHGDDDENFDLFFLIKRQADVVHIGTHAHWDQQPPLDLSTLEPPKIDEEKKMTLKERLSRVLTGR